VSVMPKGLMVLGPTKSARSMIMTAAAIKMINFIFMFSNISDTVSRHFFECENKAINHSHTSNRELFSYKTSLLNMGRMFLAVAQSSQRKVQNMA